MTHAGTPALALLALCFAGCYRAVVDTGRAPTATVIEKPWKPTFILGLVPASEIDTAAECPGGIARVETHQSFRNGLVAVATLGIYTPQHVRITCAAPTAGALPNERMIDVGALAPAGSGAAGVFRAAALSDSLEAPVLVRF